MDIEHTVKVFPIDATLKDNVDALVKEGWETVPGVAPVAVYHLVRAKQEQPATGVIGKLRIDDSLVTVIPAGTKLS